MRHRYLIAASALALAMPTAHAQQAAPAAETETVGPADIIVTARRQSERLQEVPLTITAFSGEAIEEAGLNDLRDVAALTPGLNFDDLVGGVFGAPIIRGLTQSNLSGPRNVSTFVDGVYLSDPAAIDFGLIDLERIEIVKGPVSALYGRNAFAGAINYVSKPPVREGWGGFLEVEGGAWNKLRFAGAISYALIPDRLSVRVSGVYDDFDGTYADRVSGMTAGGFRKRGGAVAVRWTPTERTDVTARAFYSDDYLGPAAVIRLTNNCGPATPVSAPRIFCGFVPAAASKNAVQVTDAEGEYGTNREILLLSLTASHDFGPFSISAIVGHNETEYDVYGDYDRTRDGELYQLRANVAPFPILPGRTARLNSGSGQGGTVDETSVEIKLLTDPARRIRFGLGGFYYTLDQFAFTSFGIDVRPLPPGTTLGDLSLPGPAATVARLNAALSVNGPGPVDPSRFTRNTLGTETLSGFASAEAEIAPGVTIRGEGRYTRDKREIDPLFNAIQFAATNGTNGVPATGRGDATFKYWNWRATAQWQIQREFLLYGSAATGTNSGGFNTGAITAIDFAYGPEKNTTYEVGIKSQLFDSRLLLNVAGFRVNWEDAQLSSPPLSAGALVNVVRNVGKIKSTGVEVEAALRVTDEFSLSFGYSNARAEFGDNAFDFFAPAVSACRFDPACAPRVQTITGPNGLPFTGVSLKGLATPRQSQGQVNASGAVELPFNERLSFFARMDASLETGQSAAPSGYARIGRRDVLNLRLGARMANGLTLTGYVDNIFDNRAASAVLNNQVSLTNFAPNMDAVYHQGRTYGVKGRYAF
jgi:outer membrane receptor protein involved in Fe transport